MNKKAKGALWIGGAVAAFTVTYVGAYYIGGLIGSYVIAPMLLKGVECFADEEAEEEQEDPGFDESMSIYEYDKLIREQLKGA